MTTTTIPEGLPDRLSALVRDVGVRGTLVDLRQVFGGNARSAWAFDLVDVEYDAVLPMIAMVRHGSGQVESDVRQEFDVLARLVDTPVPAPAPVALDLGDDLAGSVVVMERLEGTADLRGFLQDEHRGRSLMADLAVHAAALHVSSPKNGHDRAEVSRGQVKTWLDALRAVEAPPIAALESVFGWVMQHLPVPGQLTLVHGDLRPGNVLYAHDSITGVLDWELAHIGDPLEDLGWIYVSRWRPDRLMDPLEFLSCYERAAGRTVDPLDFGVHRVFAEARFAVISHRAATLFASGATDNLKHADRVRELVRSISRCIELIDEDGRP